MTYNDIARGYDELHGVEQQQKILYVKHLLENKKILDIGAGTGLLANYVNAEITGIEPSKEMIEQSHNRNINMIHGPASEIKNLPANTYTACTSFTAMHHVETPSKIYEEINRVTKKEAIVIMSFLDTTPQEAIQKFKKRFIITDTKKIHRDNIYIATTN